MKHDNLTADRTSRFAAAGLLGRLAWKFKIGWECVGGHYINARVQNSDTGGYVAYRYIWMHKNTHDIKVEDRPNDKVSDPATR